MQCKQCGFENRVGIRFCENCGATIPTEKQPAPKKVTSNKCEKCGFENRPGIRFCEECGALIDAEQPAPPAKITSVKNNQCEHCGFENRPGVRFCEDCGATLVVDQPIIPEKIIKAPINRCSQCGSENRPGVQFCENCGASMIAEEPPTPIQVSTSSPTRRSGRIFSTILKAAFGLSVIIGGFILFYILSPGSFENSFLAPYLPTINISVANNTKENDPAVPQIVDSQPSQPQPSNPQSSNSQPSNAQPSNSTSNDQQQGNTQPSAPQPVPKEDDEEEEDTCHRSRFVSETIPDYTVFAPGDKFKKTWTLSNGGECTWDPDYELRFVEGERMGGANVIELGKTIEPDDTISFSVNLTASSQIGTHTGVWQLFASDGTPMGRYWVIIQVGEEQAPPPEEDPEDPPPEPPTPPFAITNVTTNLIDVDVSAWPFAKEVLVTFTANGPGIATFEIETSDLGLQGERTITFSEAGTRTKNYTWTFTFSSDYFMIVRIREPHQTTYGPFYFTIKGP